MNLKTNALTIWFLLCSFVLALADSTNFSSNTIDTSLVGVYRYNNKFSEGAGGVRLSYDLTSKLGFFAQVDGKDFHGTLIDNAQAGLKLGVPIGLVRPYAIGSYGVRFTDHENYFGLGGGLDIQLNKRLRAFAECKYDKGTSTLHNGLEATMGLGLCF